MYGGQQFGSGMGGYGNQPWGGGYPQSSQQQSYSQPRVAPTGAQPSSSSIPRMEVPVSAPAPTLAPAPVAPVVEKSDMKAMETQLKELQIQLTSLRKENAELKASSESLRTQIKDQQEEIQGLKTRLESKEVEVLKVKSDAKKAIRLAKQQAAERAQSKHSPDSEGQTTPDKYDQNSPSRRKARGSPGSSEWTGIKDREKLRAYSGIQVREVASGTAGAVKVKVVGVHPDSPAAEAGIVVGDIICSVGSTNTTRKAIFHSVMNKASVGDIVQICIERDGERISGEVHLANQPSQQKLQQQQQQNPNSSNEEVVAEATE